MKKDKGCDDMKKINQKIIDGNILPNVDELSKEEKEKFDYIEYAKEEKMFKVFFNH